MVYGGLTIWLVTADLRLKFTKKQAGDFNGFAMRINLAISLLRSIKAQLADSFLGSRCEDYDHDFISR